MCFLSSSLKEYMLLKQNTPKSQHWPVHEKQWLYLHCLTLKHNKVSWTCISKAQLSLTGPEMSDRAVLGSAVEDVLNVVLKRRSPNSILSPDGNDNMVHCGRTKVFLTHSLVKHALWLLMIVVQFVKVHWTLSACLPYLSWCNHKLSDVSAVNWSCVVQLEMLEEHRNRVHSQKAFCIQCCWRRHQTRQRNLRTQAATRLQAG